MRDGFASIEMEWSGPGIFIGLSAMICILLNWKRYLGIQKPRQLIATEDTNYEIGNTLWHRSIDEVLTRRDFLVTVIESSNDLHGSRADRQGRRPGASS